MGVDEGRQTTECLTCRTQPRRHPPLTPVPRGDRNFQAAKTRVEVSVGESVRVMRELQEMSQNDLARATGIPQSTISAIGNERVRLGVQGAKVLARALCCHPGVLVFPGWDADDADAA